MILPGVAGAETIRLNHEQIVNPKAYACVYEENPIHAEMREVAGMAGVDLIVDVVLSPSGVLKVFVGDVIEAHRAGAAFWDERFHVPVPEQADLVIVSPGGHPRDINLYQAHKAIFNAARAVKNGGMILLSPLAPTAPAIRSSTTGPGGARTSTTYFASCGRRASRSAATRCTSLGRIASGESSTFSSRRCRMKRPGPYG